MYVPVEFMVIIAIILGVALVVAYDHKGTRQEILLWWIALVLYVMGLPLTIALHLMGV